MDSMNEIYMCEPPHKYEANALAVATYILQKIWRVYSELIILSLVFSLF